MIGTVFCVCVSACVVDAGQPAGADVKWRSARTRTIHVRMSTPGHGLCVLFRVSTDPIMLCTVWGVMRSVRYVCV